jgi:hypothetical protein
MRRHLAHRIGNLEQQLPDSPPMAMRQTLPPIMQRHVVHGRTRERLAIRQDQRTPNLALQATATERRGKWSTKISIAFWVHAGARGSPLSLTRVRAANEF